MAPVELAAIIYIYGVASRECVESGEVPLPDRLANPEIVQRRRSFLVNGIPITRYVPLYWATHTPMQYAQTVRDKLVRNDDLVFFTFQAAKLFSLNVLTTDGNAASEHTKVFQGWGAWSHLDWQILRSSKCLSPEWKRKKQAEVLVLDYLNPWFISAVIVHSELAKVRIESEIDAAPDPVFRRYLSTLREGPAAEIRVDRSYYFKQGDW